MSTETIGLVYRDAVTSRPQAAFVDDLSEDLAACGTAPDAAARTRALLSAAALEGALADAGAPEAAAAAQLTDQLAAGLCGGAPLPLADLVRQLSPLRQARVLRASRPEGFAYYGLSPRRYAEAAAQAVPGGGPVTVVGIRTAGVALSACTLARLRARRRPAWRLTVRPTGHPFGRQVRFDKAEQALLARALAGDGAVLVVDEGPGLSGSSFLAVAEALMAVGVPGQRITCFGTRPVDPTALLAADAAARWRRFHHGFWRADEDWLQPDERDLSAGRWRSLLARAPEPATLPCWPAGERLKALDHPGGSRQSTLRKFEGLGRAGGAVYRRAVALADAGWGQRPLAAPDADGFVRYAFVEGQPLTLADRSPATLGRYIGQRARLLALDELPGGAQAAFTEMFATNVALALGRPWQPARPPPVAHPTLVDGRLQPHEWLRARDGRLVKTDGAAHGDDHFFPGPTDAAWDLAGAVVEWQLDAAETGALCSSYQRTAGDDPRARLPDYLLAYAAFRARMSALCARGLDGAQAAGWRQREQHLVALVRQLVGQLG